MSAEKKYLIEFAGEKQIVITEGQTILDASLAAGIPHFHVCGGNAKCSTCRVLILAGKYHLTMPNEKEKFLSNQMHFPPKVRLACQTQVTGAVKVKRIIQDESDIGLYVGSAAGDSTQQLGEEKDLALLFLDIRNFTHIVETHTAFDIVHIIRKLFSAFQSIIEGNRGRIIETAGDGLYAVFGEDTTEEESSREQSAQSSVRAAQAMLENLLELNENYFIPHFSEKIQAGIGIHIGKVVSGTVRIGKDDHLVVMGYPVNIASRLQNATKQLDNNLIVSASVYELLDHPPSSPQKMIAVKGVSIPIVVYLMGIPFAK